MEQGGPITNILSLMVAVSGDNIADAAELLSRGTPTATMIFYARSPAMVRLLRDWGVDLNVKIDEETPLTHAIMTFNFDVATELLRLGADPNLPGRSRPLQLTYRLYLEKSQRVYAQDYNASVVDGLWRFITTLLEAGADITQLRPYTNDKYMGVWRHIHDIAEEVQRRRIRDTISARRASRVLARKALEAVYRPGGEIYKAAQADFERRASTWQ